MKKIRRNIWTILYNENEMRNYWKNLWSNFCINLSENFGRNSWRYFWRNASKHTWRNLRKYSWRRNSCRWNTWRNRWKKSKGELWAYLQMNSRKNLWNIFGVIAGIISVEEMFRGISEATHWKILLNMSWKNAF